MESDAYPVWNLAYNSGWTVYVEGSGDKVYGDWNDWNNGLAPRHSRYTYLRTAMPEAMDGAIGEAQEKISALEAYQTEFDSTLSSLQSDWSSYKAAFLGLNQAASVLTGYDNYFYVPNPRFDDFCRTYGNTDAFLEQLNAYKEKLETAKANWQEDAAALEAEAERCAGLYREQQEAVYAASERYPQVFREYRDLLAETQALYFDGKRSKGLAALVSDQKVAEETKAMAEGKRHREIYAEWGRDLSDRLFRLQALKLEQQELWDDRLTAIGICKELHSVVNVTLMNDLCDAELLSPYELERVVFSTGDASLASADAVLQDSDARRNVHADRFASLANVQRACREFTGMNELSMSHDEKAVEILSWKPAYMRASAEERAAMYDRARELLRSVNADWQLRQQYEYGGWLLDESANYIYAQFQGWTEDTWAGEAAKGEYTPVTGLAGPKTLSAADSALDFGETLNLGAQVSAQPASASDKGLVWESSDIDVCTVDENGKVTPTGCGTATVTVRAADSVRTVREDGTVTYSPAPLTYPVTVGSGKAPTDYENVNSVWKNFGTEESPRLYDVTTDQNGVRSVVCAVSPLTPDKIHIAVTLSNRDGKMLDLAFLTYDEQAVDFRTVVLRGKDPGSLRLKAFAINADGSFTPFDGVMLLDEPIA